MLYMDTMVYKFSMRAVAILLKAIIQNVII